jgi:hypothetical protein
MAFLARVGTPQQVEAIVASLPAPARHAVPALRAAGEATLDAIDDERAR